MEEFHIAAIFVLSQSLLQVRDAGLACSPFNIGGILLVSLDPCLGLLDQELDVGVVELLKDFVDLVVILFLLGFLARKSCLNDASAVSISTVQTRHRCELD